MNTDFVKMLLGTILRHAATAIAGYLVAKGLAQQDQAPAIIAAVMTFGALAWSGWQKYGHAVAIDIISTRVKVPPVATGGPSNMNAGIKTVVFLLAILLGVPQFARAADVAPPAAAPAVSSWFTSAPCTLTACTGRYIGFNVAGIGSNANLIGNGINGSIAANGQNLGGQFGYQFWNGTFFFGPEIDAEYTYGGSPVVGGYSAPKYLFAEIIKFGGPLSSIFGGIAPANTTGLASALTSQTIAPYIFVGSAQRSWGTGVASGAGVTFLIDQHWFADVRYMNVQYTGSNQASPIQTIPQENIVWAGLNYKF